MEHRRRNIVMITGAIILITKLILFSVWNRQIMNHFLVDSWHHMYTGILLIIIAKMWKSKYSYILLSIGFGLFLDEFIHVFHLLHIINEVDYWSALSYCATIISFFLFYLYIMSGKRFK